VVLRSVPGPPPEGKSRGDMVRRLGVPIHSVRSPAKVRLQRGPQTWVVWKPRVVDGLREADLRTFVHVDVLAFARVHLDDHRLVTHGRAVAGRPAERFRPIRGQSLSVLRVKAVREGVAHDGVGETPRVPCVREPQEGFVTARGVEDRLRHGAQYRSINHARIWR
jgi:hypothetical protein